MGVGGGKGEGKGHATLYRARLRTLGALDLLSDWPLWVGGRIAAVLGSLSPGEVQGCGQGHCGCCLECGVEGLEAGKGKLSPQDVGGEAEAERVLARAEEGPMKWELQKWQQGRKEGLHLCAGRPSRASGREVGECRGAGLDRRG